jgi:hypothetical protein
MWDGICHLIEPGENEERIHSTFDIYNDTIVHVPEDEDTMRYLGDQRDVFKLPEKGAKQVSLSSRKLLVLFGKTSLYASNDVPSDANFPSDSITFTKLETPADLTELLTILSLDNCHLLLGLNGKTGKKELWSYMLGPCACHGQGDSPQQGVWARCLVDP